ncbi:hypothetical protein T11_10795, partial [Trichinella zimbabwensis]
LLNWFPRDAQGDRGSINSRLCFQDAVKLYSILSRAAAIA